MVGESWFRLWCSANAEAFQLKRVSGFAVCRGMQPARFCGVMPRLMGSFFLFYAGANPANRCNLLQL